jgi:hypothetical protein
MYYFICLHSRQYYFICLHCKQYYFICLHCRQYYFICLHSRQYYFICLHFKLLVAEITVLITYIPHVYFLVTAYELLIYIVAHLYDRTGYISHWLSFFVQVIYTTFCYIWFCKFFNT